MNSLWGLAYRKLEDDSKDSNLLAGFDNIIKDEIASIDTSYQTISDLSTEDRNELVVKLIDTKLAQYKTKPSRARSDKVLASIAKYTLYAKDFINHAAQISPHVGMAWAGISILLPLLSNPRTESTARTESIDYITKSIAKFTVVEEVYADFLVSKPSQNGQNVAFRDSIVEFYASILSYQISAVYMLTKHSKTQFVRDTIRLDNLDEKLAKVKADEERCGNFFNLLDQAILKTQLDRQLQQIEQNAAAHFELLSKIDVNISRLRQDRKQQMLTSDERACHQALLPPGTSYESQKNQNPNRVAGTCKWALEHPSYVRWRDNDDRRLLWISADAGCGKSVLSRAIIDEDLPTAHADGVLVLYFFFKDTSQEQRSATRALSAVLHQLFTARPDLIKHAMDIYRAKGSRLTESHHDLWKILQKATDVPGTGRLVCLLDALDECDRNECSSLVGMIYEFYHAEQKTSSLKFLVTSRPYLGLKAELRGIDDSATIQLDGSTEPEAIKVEIDFVIKHRLSELAKTMNMPLKVQDYLEKRLLGMHQRTYLWLRLIWGLIPAEWPGNITQAENIINTIPTGIMGAYEVLLQKCTDLKFAKKVLQLVLVAYRPLTLYEIDIALQINDSSDPCLSLDLEGPDHLRQMLAGRCGLMITVVDEKVYFIHQTVKEYLVCNRGALDQDPLITTDESHRLLASLCMKEAFTIF